MSLPAAPLEEKRGRMGLKTPTPVQRARRHVMTNTNYSNLKPIRRSGRRLLEPTKSTNQRQRGFAFFFSMHHCHPRGYFCTSVPML